MGHFSKRKHKTSQVHAIRLMWETPNSCSSSWIAHRLLVGALVLLYIFDGKVVEPRATTGSCNSFGDITVGKNKAGH